MVEGILVNRKLERMRRDYRGLERLTTSLCIWPWPYVCATVFTFDCEGTFGGGETFTGETEIVPHLSRFIHENGLRATFNFVGKVVEEHPDVVKGVDKAGHDIAGHGYSHNFLDGMSYKKQKEEVEKTIDLICNTIGKEIIGWRTPYLTYDKVTYDVLAEKKFKWSSSWSRSLWGKLPFKPIIEGTSYDIVELPADDIHFDAAQYRWDAPPQELARLWINHLFVTQKELSLYVFLHHPVHMASDIQKVQAVEEVVKKAKSFPRVWINSCNEVAKRWESMNNVKIVSQSLTKNKNDVEVSLTIRNDNDFEIADLSAHVGSLTYQSFVERYDKDILLLQGGKDVLIHFPALKAKSVQSIKTSLSIQKGL